MRKPNDTKRPNSNSGSPGQFLRSRERITHISKNVYQVPDPVREGFFKTVVQHPGKTFRKPETIKRDAERAEANRLRKAAKAKTPIAKQPASRSETENV